MKILMLGGTAFFGQDIVRLLCARGHNVTLFTRGNVPRPEFPSVAHIKGDRTNGEDLRRAAEAGPWDAVIDNIAYDGPSVRIALEAFGKTKHYFLTSTISVYRFAGNHREQPLNENAIDFDYKPKAEDPNDPHWKYARGKLEAERTLIRQDRVPYTIFRPSMVYGSGDNKERGFWYLARLLKGGPLLLADGGMNPFRMAYNVDVAQCYASAIEEEKTQGRIYNLAQNEVTTLRDFIDESAAALGLKPQYISVPTEFLGGPLNLGGPLSLIRPWIPSIEAARRDLKFVPTPWDDVVATTATWFRDCWSGDEKKLLETREKELKLADQWVKLTAPLRGA